MQHYDRSKFEIRVVCLSREVDEYWTQTVSQLCQLEILGVQNGQLRRLWRIGRVVKEWRPHVIWGWHFYTALYGLPFRSFWSRPKLVAGVRNDAPYLLETHPWASYLIMRCDAVVANTQVALAALQSASSVRLGYVLRNTVDSASPIEIQETVRTIGTCGNIHPRKGIEVFLEAITLVEETDIRFQICGNGGMETYKSQANELGILERIDFLENVECSEQVRKLDVFVLPSHHEGCPNVLLEAMAAGVPCIASQVGGVPEILLNGVNGLMFDDGDAKTLSEHILRFVRDRQLREQLSDSGRESMNEYRDPARVARKDFSEVLERVTHA
ncbi:MAG: glycosyltransferase family 4 protein [Pseudomonadales bacterium]|nr:glycosyltransferase family 4 protein [Pseudomonadales bacterium]